MSISSAKLSLTAAAVCSAFSIAAHAGDPALAPWLIQMGETSAILSAAKWGSGQVIGVVDTGVVATNAVFASGQVSKTLSSCAAVSFRCSNGYNDDNGHGTSVASIAAANRTTAGTYRYTGYTVNTNSYMGVAPNANIVAEKVLNSNGSGTSADVASGINKAVAAGASVINLSLTFLPTADIIAAVNNATAKGAFIVWAGGNDAKALLNNANTNGLTANTIKHLLLVGALDTNATQNATFSNRPGSGSLLDTSGGKTSYAARWITAPGVNILAPGIQYGATAMATWSGTSMSAPLISGSLALLQSAWPILKTNGTTANLLLATTTDLGAKGIDAEYGTGRVNLLAAFSPYGPLTTTLASGKNVEVSSLSGSLITGGALGSLSSVRAKLADHLAFDTFQRNFSVDLSGLILSKPISAKTNPLPTNLNTGVVSMKLTDGGELVRWQQQGVSAFERMGAFSDGEQAPTGNVGYLAYTDRSGSTIAFGQGVSSQISFARALYGEQAFAAAASELAMSNLSDLAAGGTHFAYGTQAAADTRVALALSHTAAAYAPGNPAWGTIGASNPAGNTHVVLGLTRTFGERWTGGITLGSLSENNSLLGSTYDPHSPVGLGSNQTTSLGLSLGHRLSEETSLFAEAGGSYTRSAQGNGLIAGTSAIVSRSFGVTFLTRKLMTEDDRLSVSLKQPLRVVSGKAAVVVPGIDDNGVPQYNNEQLSLVPNGRETDFRMAYETPLGKTQTLSFQVGARRDVMNIAGNRDAGVGAVWSARF